MSLRALALDWSVDGSTGTAFLLLMLAVGAVYLGAAAHGRRVDRRGRRWPRIRTASFIAGLAVLLVDLYSGIGTEADTRLSVHMLEHMVIWVVVAPLLAAGAPIRLAFFALPRGKHRALARWLHSRAVVALSSPVGSTALFITVVAVSHLPAVYGLALRNDYVHELEHGLYLVAALLVWAPLLGVDPLPGRAGPRGQVTCMVACMVAMIVIAVWLQTAPNAVYGHYLQTLGPAALGDQRAAAMIMWIGCIPAFAVPALGRIRPPQRRRLTDPQSSRVAA